LRVPGIMKFNADTAYSELRPHFQERVRPNEPLAHHSAFGVGGPADVWVSLKLTEPAQHHVGSVFDGAIY